MGLIIGICGFVIVLLALALFGGIDTIADLVRGRKRREAETSVILDSRDRPDA